MRRLPVDVRSDAGVECGSQQSSSEVDNYRTVDAGSVFRGGVGEEGRVGLML